MNEYIKLVEDRLQKIETTQAERIERAGQLLTAAIAQDRLIYVFGAGGHTSLVVGEMFFRIGGLANIYPIVEYGLSALSQAKKFIALERAAGLGSSLIEASGIGEGDVLLLFHTIGVNATCIDAAKKAKALGAKVIGVASSHWQDETPADADIRAVGKENLRDLVDIYIDDCNTVDDAELLLEGMEVKAGPLSGIGTFAIAHLIELSAMKECLKKGIMPPVWANANTPEGSARNVALMEKYEKRIPML
ncbi:MAG: sugar isomerase domain-containing protein [Lachnospiraceae bacterium]|nr:sugar isomerase domain-containing protein [Lachnospiraceae bacterium]